MAHTFDWSVLIRNALFTCILESNIPVVAVLACVAVSGHNEWFAETIAISDVTVALGHTSRIAGALLTVDAVVVPTDSAFTALASQRVHLARALARRWVANCRHSLGRITVTRLASDWIGRLQVEESWLALVTRGACIFRHNSPIAVRCTISVAYGWRHKCNKFSDAPFSPRNRSLAFFS